ncbi:MAG: phosphatase PAP2 family protein [Bacteroidota bacterium]|nr:phosphatase PAP2 family protein [Bacteroidota bacterium]
MVKKILIIFILFSTKHFHSQNLDFKILKAVNQTDMPCWDKTMKGVSFSVYPAMPVSVIGIWTHGYINKDEVMMRNGYKSAVSIAFAIGLSTGLKYAVNRTRPFNEYPNDIVKRDNAGPYSFPSGHTTAAFATATALSLSYKKWYVTVPAYAYASMVGYSRMRLGMHYGTDVLGGMIVGIGSGLLTWQLDKAFNKK